VLKATSILFILHPLILIFVRSPLLHIFTEFFNGIILAGLNLSLANFVDDSSSQKKIIRFASYQAVFSGTFAFFALMISGIIQSFEFSFFLLSSSFYLVCALSLLLRLLFCGTLMNKIKDVRPVVPIKSRHIVFSVLTLEPVRHEMLNGTALFLFTGAKEFGRAVKTIGKIEKKEMRAFERLEKKEAKKFICFEKKESALLEKKLGFGKKK